MNNEAIDKQLQPLSINGEQLSPILPEGIKNYLIDIDGTICEDIKNEVWSPWRQSSSQRLG